MQSIAICSCPRLGYMDFMGCSVAAFGNNGVVTHNAYGVYWSQALSQAISAAIDEGFEYIFTTDYDSIFTEKEVAELIRLMDANQEVDAICSAQIGRSTGLLCSTESGKISAEAISEDLVEINQGHFGLTIFRASAIKELTKPWFMSKPNESGEWTDGKVDDDIYFWQNFIACGKNAYLAPRVVVGHLELLIKWPDQNMQGIYETLSDYHQHGKPGNAWT